MFKTTFFKNVFFIFIILNGAVFLYAEKELPEQIKKIAVAAFSQESKEKAIFFMEKEIGKLTSLADKASALKILADYEVRSGFFSDAAVHYVRSADMSVFSAKKGLLTGAFAALLLADMIGEAEELCTTRLLPLIQNPLEKDDIKTLVYYEWLKIKSAGAVDGVNAAVSTLKRYAADEAFRDFHPMILLTVWWLEDDKASETRLLQEFPKSIEAQVVRGGAVLSPQVFWYLMPRGVLSADTPARKGTLEDAASRAGVSAQAGLQAYQSLHRNNRGSFSGKKTSKASVHEKPATLFQTGFFKSEDYAAAMSAELSKKGFVTFVRRSERASGTFYSVLVRTDGKGDLVLRLKNEGYEAVPVFE